MKIRAEGRVGKMEMVGFRECHVLHGSQGCRGIGKEINGTKDSCCVVYWCLKVLFINFYAIIRKRDPRKQRDGKVSLLSVTASVW